MASEVAVSNLEQPPIDAGEQLDDPAGEDWVSLFLEDSSTLNGFDSLPSLSELLTDCPELTNSHSNGPCLPNSQTTSVPSVASPSSGLTQLSGDSSPSLVEDFLKDEEFDMAGSGTEQCRSDEEEKCQRMAASPAQPSSSGEYSNTSRTSKRLGKRKSCNDFDGEDSEGKQDDGELDEEELKRRARLMRNRESAQLSRQRKKAYVDDLEERIRTLNSTVAELNNTISLISAENVSLRNQLAYFYNSAGSVKPGTIPPSMGMPVFPFPGGYVARPMRPGYTAPPVPIPRLKTQASSVKCVKRPKVSKEDSRKGTGKAKKVASVAAMGFLCIMMLLVPFDLGIPGLQRAGVDGQGTWTQNSFRHIGDSVSRVGGRVLMSWNEDGNNTFSKTSKDVADYQRLGCDEPKKEHRTRNRAVIDGSIFPANVSSAGDASDRFPASLILPRNNELVKLDGDLIIQAIMAGDKAAIDLEKQQGHRGLSSEAMLLKQSSSSPALTNSGMFELIAAKALARTGERSSSRLSVEKQRALPSSRSESDKALPSADYKDLQQQSFNDLAGTLFSTGMCTEVFQFETSPATAESENISAEATQDVDPTRMKRRRGHHRRHLSAFTLPATREQLKRKKYNETDGGGCRRQPSSMVVSILSGPNPKKTGQSPGAKELAQVFVVVLLDGVKYVTYSCMLPPQAQVVTG